MHIHITIAIAITITTRITIIITIIRSWDVLTLQEAINKIKLMQISEAEIICDALDSP